MGGGAKKKRGEKENTSNGGMRADVGQRAEEALNQTVDVGSADNTRRDYLCCLLLPSGEAKKKQEWLFLSALLFL